MKAFALAIALLFAGGVAHAAPRGERAVTIASAADTSPGALDTSARRRHGAIVRQAMLDVLTRSGAEVGHAGPRKIDVAVVAWKLKPRGAATDVTAEIRVVVCDGHNKMIAIVTGRATVRGAATDLPALREQALASAVAGMQRTLAPQLARAVA